MNDIIRFETEKGEEFIYVEVEDVSGLKKNKDVLISVSGDDDDDEGVLKAASKFEKALAPIKRISSSVINKIREISDTPTEITVEIGLKFNAEAGVIISKASTEANLKLTLTWKKDAVK